MKIIIKKNIRLLFGLIIGCLIMGGVALAARADYSHAGAYTTYSNSGLEADDVTEAIEEINDMVRGRFLSAYEYSTSSSTKCITGEENTCVKTDCYKHGNAIDRCKTGDIIKYRVNDSEVVTFHVMYADSDTITMQSQKNIVYNTAWESNYAQNTSGPNTIIDALEKATAGWSNVKDQNYQMGTTVFQTNAYTGCSSYNTCTSNVYNWTSRTRKVRMITLQEARYLGCTSTISLSGSGPCPIWMYNYMYSSKDWGGTVDDIVDNQGYWTMTANSDSNGYAWYIDHYGTVNSQLIALTSLGARAVVVVDKD